jgi:hypothetical protein
MTLDQVFDADYQDLLAEKAQRLTDLLKRKPGQKGYKRSLRAFLEVDAAAERALLPQIDQAGSPTPEFATPESATPQSATPESAGAVSSSDAAPHPPE